MVPHMCVWFPPYILYDSYGPMPYGIDILCSPLTLCGTGIYGPYLYIWSPHMWSVLMSYMTFMVPHASYGIGIILSPHMYMWSPYMWSIFMSYMTLMDLPYCIWNRYHMVPPYILYDSYGPLYLIWNRYLMVPHMWSVFMSYMTLMVPQYLIRYLMVPLPGME